jgi:dipeptidase E
MKPRVDNQQTKSPQIIAMGGGGFSMEPDNLLLDRYVLAQSRESRPKVCFVPTASGDADDYIKRFYQAFATLNCEPSHLSLFRGQQEDLAACLADQDVIYVGGGNTRNLLTLWRDWGLDIVIRQAWERGVVLAGVSAGSISWFESGVTDSIPGRLSALTTLGFLPGSNCPHYDGESQRRPAYHKLIASGELPNGLAADDGVAFHFVGTTLTSIVTSRPEAKAYKVELTSAGVRESVHEPTYLGGNSLLIRCASPRDARGIHDAHMRSINEMCKNDYTPEQLKAWGGREYDEHQRLKMIEHNFIWVVELNGKIEGLAGLALKKEAPLQTGELLILYLTPIVAKKGLGKRLVELIEEKARTLGLKELELESTITSREFYRRCGYVETGPLHVCHTLNGIGIPGYPMKKVLAPIVLKF